MAARSALFLLFLTTGCLLPQDDNVLEPFCTATISCLCDCSLCTDRDSSGACSATDVRDEFSSTCIAVMPDAGETCTEAIDRHLGAGDFAAACDNACITDLQNGELDLVGCSSRTESVSTRDDCILSSSQGLSTTANGSIDSDEVACDPTQSYIEVAEIDGDGKPINSSRASVSCDIAARRGSLEVTMLRVRALQSVVARGTTLVDTRLSLVAPTVGAMDGSGNFSIPLFDDMFLGVARVAGSLESRAFAPTGSVAGTYDRVNGSFVAQMLLVDETAGMQFTIHLRGPITNRAPAAVISAPAIAECSRTGTNVTLDGSASSDPDGTPLTGFYWYANGLPIGSGSIISTLLPLGTHEVRLYVADDRSYGVATHTVLVRDTIPPDVQVQATPQCIWPNNHRLVRFDLSSDLRVEVSDACDPHPVAELSSIFSSEPENGLGDGDTAPDVFAGPDFVCVRAERSGTQPEGRVYQTIFRAQDASGNVGQGTTGIRVSHDSRPQYRCVELSDFEFAEEIDCLVPTSQTISTPSEPVRYDEQERLTAPTRGGCATSAAGGSSLPGLLLLYWFFSRRRSSR